MIKTYKRPRQYFSDMIMTMSEDQPVKGCVPCK